MNVLVNDVESIKIVLLGDSSVGKTSIIKRFVNDEYEEHFQTTQGVSFESKQYTLENGITYDFKIWDTAGQERYRAINTLYYRDAKVAILVYDITDKQSFETLKFWAEEVKSKGMKNTMLAVVGNKQDLHFSEKVKYDKAQDYAKQIGAIFKLTSAKDGKGINDLFKDIAYELEQKLYDQKQRQQSKLRERQKQRKMSDLQGSIGGSVNIKAKKPKKKQKTCC